MGQDWASALPSSRPIRCMFHRKAARSPCREASRRFNNRWPAMPGARFRIWTAIGLKYVAPGAARQPIIKIGRPGWRREGWWVPGLQGQLAASRVARIAGMFPECGRCPADGRVGGIH